jgi:hypothetical protein
LVIRCELYLEYIFLCFAGWADECAHCLQWAGACQAGRHLLACVCMPLLSGLLRDTILHWADFWHWADSLSGPGLKLPAMPGLALWPIFGGRSPLCRHWKDHLKNDRRSDQDHRLKLDRRSDQDHPFKKNDRRSRSRSYIIFCPQSPLFEGHFLIFF